MKIAYVSFASPMDPKAWSGTIFHVGEALRKQGVELDLIGPIAPEETLAFRAKVWFYTKLLKQNLVAYYDPLYLHKYAAETAKRLQESAVDAVLTTHTFVLAALQCKQPIIYWVDSCFGGMQNFYSYYTNLCQPTLRDGYHYEKLAFDRCRLALFSSDWAAETAIQYHGLDRRKARVVPYGANIECTRTEADVREIIAKRSKEVCKLLFIGKVWERKGGDIVVKVAERLNELGLPTELTLVGSEPKDGQVLPSFIKSAGFINKSTPEGKRLMDSLIEGAHFLIVPSRAEAYGIVFCEASSFGVPSIASNAGGIPTVVRDGINGQTFDLNASIDDYCTYVQKVFRDRAAYERLAESSFQEYQRRLNWDAAGKQVKSLLEAIL